MYLLLLTTSPITVALVELLRSIPSPLFPEIVSFAPETASNAYTLESRDPTYTAPFATAGDEVTMSPVSAVHSSRPVLALNAYRLWSAQPK